jgi:hypothetical protein
VTSTIKQILREYNVTGAVKDIVYREGIKQWVVIYRRKGTVFYFKTFADVVKSLTPEPGH